MAADETCDVLVVGSGAGGLATAVVARALGLEVIVVEKEPVFGGTSALSGGALWVPGHPLAGGGDTAQAAAQYLRGQAGEHYDDAAVRTFLENAPRMVRWFEENSAVRFMPSLLPDYHPEAPGGALVGRSIMARPFDTRELGADRARLRPPLRTITFLGMMFNSSNEDLKHFFNATRSLKSFLYVLRRLVRHAGEVARYGGAVQVTTGNALVARLARSAFDRGVPIRTSQRVRELSMSEGRVTGAVVEDGSGQARRIRARRGVVLACGGFPHDEARRARHYTHVRQGAPHLSPAPASNTGDGLRMAEQAGARVEDRYPHAAAWIPVSEVPLPDGRHGVFPHLQDRYKPGMIAVDDRGERFCNEAVSYHDMGAAMIQTQSHAGAQAWLLCDHRAIRRYGLGFAKPAPMPLGPYLRSGYLRRGRTLEELAANIGVPAQALQATVRRYNDGAAAGQDPDFHRGASAFGRYLGDAQHQPNPCVAPVTQAPFYAVRLAMGDLGTFHGLRTTPEGAVLDEQGTPIAGLWAVGNDRASIMGGAYPGGGITLGPAMTFGYVTAHALAAQSPDSNS